MDTKNNRICQLFSIKYPVLQAPMSWITNAGLAAAISNAGGLGIIGPNTGAESLATDVVETGECLCQQIRKTKLLTNKPFGVSVLTYRGDSFRLSDQCVKVILEEWIAVASLCGGKPDKYSRQLKDAGIKLLYRPLPFNNEKIAKQAEQTGINTFTSVWVTKAADTTTMRGFSPLC
jgi:enoyl-[acyl-carrier protein] reductase II